jgi:predicted transcriptional regulator
MHIITVVKENYIEDIEKALNQRKKPMELLNITLGFLNFKSVEIRIYNLLLKTSLTIKQLEQQLNISERTIRKYIKRLDEEGFIIKKVEQGKRLKYIYMAVPIQETWEKVKDKIEKILGDITKVLETKTMFF